MPQTSIDTRDTKPSRAETPGREVSWGHVNAFSVDADRLMIQFETGAIGHLLVIVRSDAPHFRTSVSMAMLAHHTKQRLTIRYEKATAPGTRPEGKLLNALEIGMGRDPEKALSFADWPIDPDDVR